MPGPRQKNVALNRISERCRQRVLVILKLRIKLMKCAFPQFRIALHQKRAERTLGKRFLPPRLISEHTELHVHIGELRKCVVVTAQRDAAQRQNSFFRLGQDVRFHSPDFVLA